MDNAHVTLVSLTDNGEPRTVMAGNRLCGYCTPGQFCSAIGMLTETGPSAVTADLAADPPLRPGEIRERMSGNRCRCGTAVAIGNAVWPATGRPVRDLPITPAKLLSEEPDSAPGGRRGADGNRE